MEPTEHNAGALDSQHVADEAKISNPVPSVATVSLPVHAEAAVGADSTAVASQPASDVVRTAPASTFGTPTKAEERNEMPNNVVSLGSASASASGTFAQPSASQNTLMEHLPASAKQLAGSIAAAGVAVTQGPKASIARPIMTGTLTHAGEKLLMSGEWKMHEKDTISSPFEYSSDHAPPGSWPPSSMQSVWLSLSGSFQIALTEPASGSASSMAVPEKESLVVIGGSIPVDAPPAPQGTIAVGLRGSGKNRYGDFQLRGWFIPGDASVKLLRIYTTQKPTKRAPASSKAKTPGKRRTEAAAVLPRTQRRRSAPKRLAEVGFTGEMTAELRACYNMLESMMKAKGAMFFLEPVDPVALNLPDYFDIVKEPMDYNTIKDKIKRGDYSEPAEFEKDMLLVYGNAILYNPVGDPVRMAAEKERDVFRTKMRDMQEQWAEKARKAKAALEAKARKRDRSFDDDDSGAGFVDSKKPRGQLSLPSSMAFPSSVPTGVFSQPSGASAGAPGPQAQSLAAMAAATSAGMDPNSLATMMQVMQALNGGGVDPGVVMQALQAQQSMRAASAAQQQHVLPPSTTPDARLASGSSVHVASSAPLTHREKQQLADDVSLLTDAQMDHVVRIVRERMHIPADQTDIELDVDNMDTGTLRALQQYVTSCLGGSAQAEKKKAPKRKPKSQGATKSKPVKRKPKSSAPPMIPPARATFSAAPSTSSANQSLTSLQSQLGINSGPSLPAAPSGGLGGGLAAAMDDALDLPVSGTGAGAATSSTEAVTHAQAAATEAEDADDFNFDASGWDDAGADTGGLGGGAAAGAASGATKLAAALQASTSASTQIAGTNSHATSGAPFNGNSFADDEWGL